ncbi:MAG: mannose-1-phosphate guanylyltransferase/mannose-6-phosphate isomerase [Methanosarcina thermophila]|jgi:mannose-1-phosphate guanylyltransferase/mannose-6-phosphate isomerase|uniref:mannose-1-phosphate guanylyltransferase n=3 Tax=Methanosarcina thermophila TaxID=2210 RepID=A0A1I6YEI6_METTE|nr:mannose-1-phosphate guanylyltransferase/mannose-6-phosphate isomerase [Methanosarcina thermophila]ALK05335.1 MAG: mannose-1-phosphate guanyltransferase [Methanosarcina sp. 795]AKB14120.1 Mannose-1-phosphate guanylyltransferase (GDP) [Methanosarcina thermophila TM-1]AKB15235.1 Mannose-1-phosphate guanylyltransferase (GDP) [Methanosarcina thermophila CHTI-55]NLU56108.1 mannose-1-phosphate guanylyltransferase/mannose-6-phosphate isomerase [Methanosarcina thermophila]SFT48935.1 mannose-1-phosph
MTGIKSIILAGGSGTRLWPLSREMYPKQFLKFGDTSLFQETVLRCLEISNISEIFVVTNEAQKFFVIGQIMEMGYTIPPENVLIEPEGKNTLPAIFFGMREIEKKFGRSVVGVFSSDHVLDRTAMQTISSAEGLASDYLVTFGVVPSFPHTGYGYIKTSEICGPGYRVSEFREKPDLETAKKYIQEGCLWNSGMFLLDTQLFFEEVKKHAPSVFACFENGKDINEIYACVDNISIDYGIMEKSDRVAVVKLEQKWSDLGNFAAIYDELEKDPAGNVVLGCDPLLLSSDGNLVYSKCGKIVSLIDIKDMVVVDTSDALLICPKSSSQKVKDVVTTLKDRKDERAEIGQTVYRPWGSYTVLEASAGHKIKNITVLPNHKLSLQLHYHRSEHWVVVKGMACVEVGGQQSFLRPGESTFIRAGEKHRLSNPGKVPLEIIEVQLGELVDEEDIVRFDDVYGRK